MQVNWTSPFCLIFAATSLIAPIAVPISAQARPVSYADSWTVMSLNDATQNSLHVHYTMDRQHSIGVRLRYDKHADALFTGAQLNKLLKRWNKPDSQANLYAKIALGRTSDDTDRANSRAKRATDTGYMIALAGDWETRKYFISGEAQRWDQGRFGGQTSYHGRLGFAPYVANTGALHTWLMGELHHRTNDTAPLDETRLLDQEETLSASAIIRLFKGPSLLELGVDSDGQPLLNYIHRF